MRDYPANRAKRGAQLPAKESNAMRVDGDARKLIVRLGSLWGCSAPMVVNRLVYGEVLRQPDIQEEMVEQWQRLANSIAKQWVRETHQL